MESKEETPKIDEVKEEIKSEKQTDGKKGKRPYVWTEKRLAAFEKMREGLKDKVEITKKLKEEKKLSEKEEIKRRVKEIMSKTTLKGGEKEKMQSDSESSEEEVKVVKKSKKEKIEKKKKAEPEAKKRKSKKAQSESEQSSSSSEEKSSESESSEEEGEIIERRVSSQKQHKHHAKAKIETGKVAKRSQYLTAMDQFILL